MSTTFDPADPIALDSVLSEEEIALRDAVRRFVRERAIPGMWERFEAGTFDLDLVPELAALGLLGMTIDGYGCAGTSATAYGLASAELEYADSGLRSFVSVQSSLAMFAIHRYADEALREHYLPRMAAGEVIGCFGLTEPDVGSNPSDLRTRARRDGPDWIIDGRKMWITNGTVAGVAIVWAQTDEGVRGFLVDTSTPGFSAHKIEHKLSLRASITAELALDGVRVPADRMLAVEGLRGPLSCLNEARFGVLWGVTGSARACYDAALTYAKQREQFGRPIAGFQLVQAKLSHMAVELSRSQLLALHLGRAKDAGRLTPEQVSIGKLSNARSALETARIARSVLGGNGISLEFPVIRHMVNLESVVTYEGSEEMHTLTIGRAITGHAAFS